MVETSLPPYRSDRGWMVALARRLIEYPGCGVTKCPAYNYYPCTTARSMPYNGLAPDQVVANVQAALQALGLLPRSNQRSLEPELPVRRLPITSADQRALHHVSN